MTALDTEASTRNTHVNNPDRLNPGAEFEALMERIEKIVPLVKENAEENERHGRLTDVVVDALHETGAFRIGIPKMAGGYELTPWQSIQVIERLSYADPSTGWAFMALQMATGSSIAYLGEDADDLFPDGDYRLIAGQATRPGTVKRIDGGYLLSGQWSFASGLHHASYIYAAGFDTETQRPLAFVFPKEKAEVVDNWNVMGLKATGSIDYSCSDLFVPDSHTHEAATGTPKMGGALYKTGSVNLSGICHTGWALGVARRMLDELQSYAADKTGTPGAWVDTQQFYAEYADAEAGLSAARAWAREVWLSNEASLDFGDALTTEQESLTRLMLNYTTRTAQSVGLTVHKWAATTAIRDGDLQRLFRDLNVGTQHITSGPQVLQSCGKYLAGLAPTGRWVFLNLNEDDAK